MVNYFAMLAAAAGVVLLVLYLGPSTASAIGELPAPSHTVTLLLLTLLAVVVLGRVFTRVLRQPPVVGEILAGVVLGLLGAKSYIAPVLPTLGAVSQLGVVLYMFGVGLALDGRELQGKTRALIGISHATIVVPFAIGVVVALDAYPRFGSQAPFHIFALFLGIAMSITAFPVLARILTDRRLETTPIGQMALACAAFADVTAWIMLALIVGAARAALPMIALTALYAVVMYFVVRPLVARASVIVLLCAMLASAIATEAIGIHALFGAFFMGALVPAHSQTSLKLRENIDAVVGIVFLPAFFAYTGIRAELGAVTAWGFGAVFIVIAVTAKITSGSVASRIAGYSWREAMSLGVLMNTRGLMELVVLNVGLDLGILPPELFAIGVVMALVTTLMTGPVITRLIPPASPA